MAILKKSDIAEKDILDDYIKKVKIATKKTKKLQDQVRAVQKAGTGAEAKERVELTNKITRSTKKLKDALTAEERVKQQILRANAKLAESRSKAAKDLALVKQRTLEQNKANRELAKSQLGVKKSTNGLISSFKAMGKQLAGALGVTALIGLLVNQFKKASERATELIKSTNKLKGTFNITTREAKKLASQINAIANNFNDVDVGGLEIALTAIVKTFDDISEQDALDLIQEGFQKGSNNSGEFLDILREYPVQFKAAGIDAKTMFAIINQQVKQGIYSDKGVDAIKEGGLRLRENTKAVQEALKPLSDSIKLQIKQEIAAGNSFKAIQLVSEALSDTSLTAEQTQTIIADVFGGAGEDAGLRYLQTLADIKTNLNDVIKETTITADANLKLTKSYNNFILSVSDGTGIISNATVGITNMGTEFFKTATIFNETDIKTKLKILTNLGLDLIEKAFLPMIGILKLLGIELPKFRFEIEKTSKALKLNTIDHKENTRVIKKEDEVVVKLTEAQKKANTARAEENRLLKEKQTIKQREADLVPTIESKGGQVELTALQKLEDDKALIRENARAREAEKTKEAQEEALALGIEAAQAFEDAVEELKLTALNSGLQLARDIFGSFQDERLAEINSDAEAQKKILQERLDKGIISEEEFANKSKEIDKKVRIESAKSERKKALFSIAINTILAIIKTFAQFGFPIGIAPAAVMAGIGAIQAAAVLATPLPKLAEGGEIGGKSHSQGGTLLEGEKGEFMINKEAYSNAPDISNMINDGLITDKGFNNMVNQDTNMLVAGLLMSGNKTSKEMLIALLNGGHTVTRNGLTEYRRNDGSIEKFIE